MSKYIKYQLVDAQTGAATNGQITQAGLTQPQVAGLDDRITVGIWHYGICDDAAVLPDQGSFMTGTAMSTELTPYFNQLVAAKTEAVRQIAWAKRTAYTAAYHPSELVSATYKVPEVAAALAAVDDAAADAAAPTIKLEATARNCTTKVLAGYIQTNYNNFIALDTALAGWSGRLRDAIALVTMNSSNPFTGFDSLNAIVIDPSTWPV